MTQVQCPKCYRMLSTSDDMQGKPVSCPACQHVFTPAPAPEVFPSILLPDVALDVPDVPLLQPDPAEHSAPPIEVVEEASPEAEEEEIYYLDEEETESPEAPQETTLPTPRPRRRKKKRARRQEPTVADAIEHQVGQMGPFPLVLASFLALWLLLGCLSYLSPTLGWLQILAGGALFGYGIFRVVAKPAQYLEAAAVMILAVLVMVSGLALMLAQYTR